MYILLYIYIYVYMYINSFFLSSVVPTHLIVCTKWVVKPHLGTDGVAMIRRLLENIGLFCRI